MNAGPRQEGPKNGATQTGLTTSQLAPGSGRALAELKLTLGQRLSGGEGGPGSPAPSL